MIVLNDLHIGAIRSGGTTPYTAWQLRQNLLENFQKLVENCDQTLMILGDLFDTHNINAADFFRCYEILSTHCANGASLILVPGNHDLSKNDTVLSSFQLLCKLLHTHYPVQVTVITGANRVQDGYVIPHVANQDIFDLELSNCPTTKYVFLHCNYDNKFAQQADHSLNLSVEQAEKLPCERVIIAHEHQAKEALNGKVLIIGNQFPSSIADCLGNSSKYGLCIRDGRIERFPTWTREGSFSQQDWRELHDDGTQFIRVVGSAGESEAAEVVSAISRFRASSKALIITNAVQIEGVVDNEQFAQSLEQAKAFDIMQALQEILDPTEWQVVSKLLNDDV